MADTTVYAVSRGYYSDYHIDSIWEDKEVAEQYATTLTDGRVEEYRLNTRANCRVVLWEANIYDEIRPDGTLTNGGNIYVRNTPDAYADDEEKPLTNVRIDNRTPYGAPRVEGYGYGPTPEHAKKSLSDMLASTLATYNGLT